MMKRLFFVLPVVALVALLFLNCDAEGGSAEAPPKDRKLYAIGDAGPSGVGIVFYVTDGGLHGLEVALEDQSTGTAWSNIINSFANGNSALPAETGTGSENTDAIIAQTDHTASAAQICRDYRLAEEGDWFLPSKDELQEIWWNLVSDQSADNEGRGKPHAGSLGGFDSEYYWSSSESSIGGVWSQTFHSGFQADDEKDTERMVRAVRAF